MGEALTFKDGFLMGLRAAAHSPSPEATREQIAKLEARATGRVDGEAEWQSWMIEIEVQSWNIVAPEVTPTES